MSHWQVKEANAEITPLIFCEFGVDPLYKIIIFDLKDESNKLYLSLSSFSKPFLFMNLLMAGLFLCISSGETFMTTKNG